MYNSFSPFEQSFIIKGQELLNNIVTRVFINIHISLFYSCFITFYLLTLLFHNLLFSEVNLLVKYFPSQSKLRYRYCNILCSHQYHMLLQVVEHTGTFDDYSPMKIKRWRIMQLCLCILELCFS